MPEPDPFPPLSGARRGWFWWLGLCLCLALLPLLARAADGPRLDADTRAWLAGHARWRVGVAPDWPPIDHLDANRAYTGLSADVLDEAAKRLGVSFEVVPFRDYEEALKAAEEGRIDLLSSLTRTPQRERRLGFTQSYARLAVAYLGRQGMLDFSESPDFGGRTLAVERGFFSEELLRSRFPQARLLVVDNTLAALQAVSQGRADLYRGALLPAHYLIERELIANLAVVNREPAQPTELHFASRERQIVQALDAALDAIGPQQLRAFSERWRPLYLSLLPRREAVAPAASAVQQIGEVRVAYDAGFDPISREGQDGEAGGLAVALLRRSAEAVGLRYRFLREANFSDAVEALKAGRADVVVAAVNTPERQRYARFVGPYYRSPSVLVSRNGDAWTSLDALAGRTLAIDRDHYLIQYIQRHAPGVRIAEVDGVMDALRAVAEGRADVGVANVEFAASAIPESFAGRLHVSGQIEESFSELSFMVRQDRPDIAQALAAGLEAVPPAERRALINAELRTKVGGATNWRQIAIVATPLLTALVGLAVAGFVYAGRLRRARARAQGLLESKTRFMAELGHDVRTPLVAMAAGLRLLLREPLPPKAERLAQDLTLSAEQLVQLLSDLLDLAKLEAGRLDLNRAPGDMIQILRESLAQFQPVALGKGLALELQLSPAQLPPLMMDPARTRQVVNNLVANAIKFTESGSVTLGLDATLQRPGRWALRLSVIDTGLGMDEATQRAVFERFTQGQAAVSRGGHGLGLSIVSDLVRLARGRIEVHSAPGQGTRIDIFILAEEAAAPSGEPALPPQRQQRVFLVEDDAVMRLVTAATLRRQGFEVLECQELARADLEFAASGCYWFITDARLGEGLRGEALAARVKARHGDAAATLVLSGDEAPVPLPAGVDRWERKPASPTDEAWLQALRR